MPRLEKKILTNCYNLARDHFLIDEFNGKKCLVVEGKTDCDLLNKIFEYSNRTTYIMPVKELALQEIEKIGNCKFNREFSKKISEEPVTNCSVKVLIDRDYNYDYKKYKATVGNNCLYLMDYRDLESTIVSTNNNGCFGLAYKPNIDQIKSFVYSLVTTVALSLVGDSAHSVRGHLKPCLKYKITSDELRPIQDFDMINYSASINDVLSLIFKNQFLLANDSLKICYVLNGKITSSIDGVNLSNLFDVDFNKKEIIVKKDYIDNEVLTDIKKIENLFNYARGHFLMASLNYEDINNYITNGHFNFEEFKTTFTKDTIIGKELDCYFNG